jgi:hypothetical protein
LVSTDASLPQNAGAVCTTNAYARLDFVHRDLAQQDAQLYLRQLDRLLPGAVVGLYLVGSVALGGYRRRRSDLDFVGVLDSAVDRRRVGRLRIAHAQSGLVTGSRALTEGRSPLTGTLNGVFISESDLPMPVTRIRPVASQVGTEFKSGRAGSDLSPVGWNVLSEKGIAIRGPHPSALNLDPEPDRLRSWTAGNLDTYWRPWVERVMSGPQRRFALRPRYWTAWGVLGAPRLHCTIATGEVISKEAAGEYARREFAPQWQPLIEEALGYWREEPALLSLSGGKRARMTAEFVSSVVEQGQRLLR